MDFPAGYLAEHPLPSGIQGALSLSGYQLLADVGGVGTGRLGPQAFLLVAPDPDPNIPEAGTQISLHQPRLRNEGDMMSYIGLAAQIGYLRMSGYRLTLERDGLRTHIGLMNPATGGIAAKIPSKHPGRLLGGGVNATKLLAVVKSLPPAGPPPDTSSPELLREVYLALALGDANTSAVEAVELADRALELARANPQLPPPAALEAARRGEPAEPATS
jgi:hypothetical protein